DQARFAALHVFLVASLPASLFAVAFAVEAFQVAGPGIEVPAVVLAGVAKVHGEAMHGERPVAPTVEEAPPASAAGGVDGHQWPPWWFFVPWVEDRLPWDVLDLPSFFAEAREPLRPWPWLL